MKKFHIVVLMLAAWLLVPWEMAKADVYIDEDFESVTRSNPLPSGWDNSLGTTTNASYRWSYDYNNSYSGVGGSRCVRFESSYNDMFNTNVLRTPVFSSPTTLQIQFQFKNPQGGPCVFYIENITDNTNIVLDSLGDHSTPDWTEYSYVLNSCQNAQIRLCFKSESNYGAGDATHYLDNVFVRDLPTCPVPVGLLASEVTNTSVLLSWNYEFEIMASGDEALDLILTPAGQPEVVRSITSSDRTYEITGLTPGTEYSVKLRRNCSSTYSGRSEDSEPLTFATISAPVELPITESFDSMDRWPVTWIRSKNADFSQSWNHGETRGKSVRLLSETSSVNYFVTPPIDHNNCAVDNMQISMWILGSAGGSYSVCLVDDPFDPSTFIPVITDSITESGIWKEVRVNTSGIDINDPNFNLAGKDVFIGVLISSGTSNTCFVDDIDIRQMPTCSRPERMSISGLSHNQATIAWDQTGTPSSYEVEVVAGSDTSVRTATSNPFVLDNLTAQTDYKVRVRALCGGGDYSEWTAYQKFRTLCDVLADPTALYLGFENEMELECWDIQTSEDAKYYPWTRYSSSYYSHGGSYSISRSSSAPAGSHSLLISQPVRIDQANKYMFKFWLYRRMSSWSAEGEGVRVWFSNTPDTTGATAVRGDFINIDGQYTPVQMITSSTYFPFELPIPLSGDVYIIIDGVTQGYQYIYIDDMSVELAPTCIKPKDIALSAVKQDLSVDLSWEAGRDETQWVVRYALSGGSSATADTVTLSQRQFSLTGLASSSSYHLSGSVASLCGGSDTSEWVEFDFSFITPCDAISEFPFAEGFEETVPPTCWSNVNAVMENSWTKDTGRKNSGGASAMLPWAPAGTRTYLVTPQFNLPASGDYKLSFYQYREVSQSDSFPQEGVRVWINSVVDTVGGEMLVFVPSRADFAPAVDSSGFYRYEVDIPAARRGLQYIIFEGCSEFGRQSYIDDVRIRENNSCAPIDAADVSFENIGSDSLCVTVSDADIIAGGSWSLEYGPAGIGEGKGEKVHVAGGITSSCISGLEQGTAYQVRVRRDCGAGGVSEWTDLGVCSTSCDIFEVTVATPFLEDFQSYPENEVVAGCYYQPESNNGGYFSINTGGFNNDPYNDPNVAGTQKSAFLGHSRNSWIMRPLRLHAGVNYEISALFANDARRGAEASMGIATSPDGDMRMLVEDEAVSINRVYAPVTTTFSVPSDGVYYVGWFLRTTIDVFAVGMDNLSVREICIVPTTTVLTTENAATLTVSSGSDKVEVMVLQNNFNPDTVAPGHALYHDSIVVSGVSNQFNVAGLAANTEYYYATRAVCGEAVSDWSPVATFRTQCAVFPIPFEEGFEPDTRGSLSCWQIFGEGQENHTATATTATQNSGSYSFKARAAEIVLPALDVENLTGYQLTFSVLANTDSATFAVGTYLTAGMPETYNVMADFVVPEKTVWQEFTVYFTSLNDFLGDEEMEDMFYSKYVVFSASSDANFYFDDIKIVENPSCLRPVGLAVTNVGTNSFDLSWTKSGSENEWQVNVYKVDKQAGGAMGTTLVKSQTVSGTPSFSMADASASTKYYATVAAVCGAGDTSEVATSATFMTACGVVSAYPFFEDLEEYNSGEVPACWNVRTDGSETGYAAAYKWQVASEGDRKFLRTSASYLNDSSILWTPYFLIDSSDYLLSFDYLNNYATRPMSVEIEELGGGSTDVPVEISVDWMSVNMPLTAYAGKTIRLKFSVDADYQGSTSRAGVDNFRISCLGAAVVHEATICPGEDYSGFGFDIPARTLSVGDTTYEFRQLVDNVAGECAYYETLRIHTRPSMGAVKTISACPGETYTEWPFDQEPYIDLSHGQTKFQIDLPAVGDTCAGTYYLYVTYQERRRSYQKFLCEGDAYNFYGQNITTAGTYEHTFLPEGAECDSIIVCEVVVVPVNFPDTAEICEGNVYPWRGQTLAPTKDTICTDTEVNTATGCDVTYTLYLKVTPAAVDTNATICEGSSFLFFGKEYKETGEYIDTMAYLGSECTTVYTLHLTVTPAVVTPVDVTACEGEPFSGYGLSEVVLTSDTAFYVEHRDVEDECLSYEYVNIHVVATQYKDSTVVLPAGGSVVVGGNSYAEPTTVVVREGNAIDCWTVVTYHIVSSTAVENVYGIPVTIAPNPVEAGSVTYINRDFSASEIDGMRVEVINAVGQTVDVAGAVSASPMAVAAPAVSGVYYIRITTGTGEVYVGKLIVK